MGLRIIFHVLADFGEADLAFKMITRLDYPSYGNWIARGATSMWEFFQPEGGGVSSLNHHFFGDISSWFIQKVAGIRPNPYCEDVTEVVVAPCFVSQLSFAEAAYAAPDGRVQVRWERIDGGIVLKVSADEALHGQIRLPVGWKFENGLDEKMLTSGEYRCVNCG